MHDRSFNGIFVVVVLRSHHLPRLYLASVRRRRNGSVSVGGILRSCWRDLAMSLVIHRNEKLYARRVFVIEERCMKDGAISRQRPAMTTWTPAATRSINQFASPRIRTRTEVEWGRNDEDTSKISLWIANLSDCMIIPLFYYQKEGQQT